MPICHSTIVLVPTCHSTSIPNQVPFYFPHTTACMNTQSHAPRNITVLSIQLYYHTKLSLFITQSSLDSTIYSSSSSLSLQLHIGEELLYFTKVPLEYGPRGRKNHPIVEEELRWMSPQLCFLFF